MLRNLLHKSADTWPDNGADTCPAAKCGRSIL
jgi:hypothetical protein